MSPAEFQSVGERESWEKGCAGKERYPTEGAAEAHATFLYRGRLRVVPDRIPRQEWGAMLPYKCSFSDPENPHWHLGHPSKL